MSADGAGEGRVTRLAVVCSRCGTPVVHVAGAEAPACPKCPPEPLNNAEFLALREVLLRVVTAAAAIPTDTFDRFIATHEAAVAQFAGKPEHAAYERELRVMRAVYYLRTTVAAVAAEETA